MAWLCGSPVIFVEVQNPAKFFCCLKISQRENKLSTTETQIIENRAVVNSLKFLSPRQVQMIDEALASLDEFGEVRLIVEKGRLRFLATQKSFDALKWQPGSIRED
jgi:hypothetical protein